MHPCDITIFTFYISRIAGRAIFQGNPDPAKQGRPGDKIHFVLFFFEYRDLCGLASFQCHHLLSGCDSDLPESLFSLAYNPAWTELQFHLPILQIALGTDHHSLADGCHLDSRAGRQKPPDRISTEIKICLTDYVPNNCNIYFLEKLTNGEKL
jgi:hypothetical protein